jgi:predicted DNA-binding protein
MSAKKTDAAKEDARKAAAERDVKRQSEREKKLEAARNQALHLRRVKALAPKPGKTLAEIIREAYPNGLIELINEDENTCKLSLEDGSGLTFTFHYNEEKGEIDLSSANGTPLQIYAAGLRLALKGFEEGSFGISGPENEENYMLKAINEVLSEAEDLSMSSSLKRMIDKNKLKCNGKYVGFGEDGQLVLNEGPSRKLKITPIPTEPDKN